MNFFKQQNKVSLHIRNIFKEGELDEISVVKDYLTTASDGKQYSTNYYNLDVAISVGYRVKSHRGTQFRIWATKQLKEYIVKGFVLNDEKLKETGHTNQYFDELFERIRDIRSSEKIFYAKIRDIYTTAIDYDPTTEESQLFFKSVQNKMHWAIHGHTASEMMPMNYSLVSTIQKSIFSRQKRNLRNMPRLIIIYTHIQSTR